MGNLLNFIPGFRSGTKWKKFIASSYYVTSLFTLFSAGFWPFLIVLCFPVLVISFVDLFFYKSNRIPRKRSLVTMIIAFFLIGFSASLTPETGEPSQTDIAKQTNVPAETKVLPNLAKELVEEKKEPEVPPSKHSSTIKVHFIDVGQGDSILIQTSNKAILVDGGTASAGQTVINYIKAQGISKLDVVVATHPHEDHIGGLIKVIQSLPIMNFYMPNKSHTTRTFENLVAAINQSGAKRIQAKAGVTFELDGLNAKFIAPNSTSYRNLNDFSAALKITHGSNAFLLTGDAESVSEQEMMSVGHNLKAKVLKVGHHGSNSSTTDSFLRAVAPKAAVISAGRGNRDDLQKI